MQYTFPLPDGYDMNILRARVAERRSLFDRLEGLYQKAFLISEQGIFSAARNSYAPFYLWNYAEAMVGFLASDKFKAVAESFGRPAVDSWLPLYFSGGKAQYEKPVFATKEVVEVAPDVDLEILRKEQYRLHRQWAEHEENQSGFIGIDANAWRIVRFALWTRPQANLTGGIEAFEVLHLAAPGWDPTYFESPC